MHLINQPLDNLIESAVEQNRILSLKTYLLSVAGCTILDQIISTILGKYQQLALKGMTYALVKELVMNATKANLKRTLFEEHNLAIADAADYEQGMILLRQVLQESRVMEYKNRLKAKDYWTMITFYFDETVLNIKVKNSFPLLPIEEERVRQKLERARQIPDLSELLAELDDTESAGLGLSMICITLRNQGVDNRSFTLRSNNYQETAAKLEIPFVKNYIPKDVRLAHF
ncbi:MAG: hypothetical protein KDK39_09595 [Leptospiraceae bacterium]|nr:hypothetical protein [Leptospiraceae bacterium]